MRPIPLLLRVLLCIAFLANGVAGVQAAVRMAMPRADAHMQVRAMPAAGGCHHEAAAPDVATKAAPAPHTATPGHGDCCKDVRCDGLCAPPAVQLPAALAIAPPPAPAPLLPRPHRGGHAPPPLPHDLRPPIG